jgi:hypothetical protein
MFGIGKKWWKDSSSSLLQIYRLQLSGSLLISSPFFFYSNPLFLFWLFLPVWWFIINFLLSLSLSSTFLLFVQRQSQVHHLFFFSTRRVQYIGEESRTWLFLLGTKKFLISNNRWEKYIFEFLFFIRVSIDFFFFFFLISSFISHLL